MFSPEATNGVMTWAYSPPSRNSVRMASAATSHSRTPSAIAATPLAVTASASAVASSSKRDLLRHLDHARLLHRGVAILDDQLGKFLRQSFDENRVGFVQSHLGVGEPMLAENGAEDFIDHSLDQRLFLDDRNGVRFFDPGHGAIDAVALSARAEQDRRFAFDQKRAVERGGLAGDQLRAKISQVAAIFVLPDQ